MSNTSDYRPDVDGLRGVAVVSVLAFHFWPSFISGGFVGVDIFFVISGYLISLILLKDFARGKFSISNFYARRVKRIFPSLVAVLFATLIIGWLILFAHEFANLGKDIIGGAGFVANILLWRDTGYFAVVAERKPLLHLWSLGVEEQFYIFYPIFLWAVYRYSQRPIASLLLVLSASFILSIYCTNVYPGAAFYLPFTRLWELLTGCILACYEQRTGRLSSPPSGNSLQSRGGTGKPLNNSLITVAAIAGLAMILGSVVFPINPRSFPGFWAVLPTLGAGLVIWSGTRTRINRLLLSNKVIVGIGLISYPLYLWHWPLLAFARIGFGDSLPAGAILALIVSTFVLSYITYKYIECPIRFGGVLGSRSVLILSSAMLAVVILSCGAFARLLPSRLALTDIGEEVDAARQDFHYPFADNSGLDRNFRRDVTIPSAQGSKTVLFVGDSHMQHYWPRIEFVLKNRQGNARAVSFITAGGCPTLPNVNRVKRGYASDKLYEYIMSEAARPEIDTVVISSFWEIYFIGCYPGRGAESLHDVRDSDKTPLRPGTAAFQRILDEFGASISRLAKMGKKVVVILSNPSSYDWAPLETPRMGGGQGLSRSIKVSRRAFEAFVSPVNEPLAEVVVRNGGEVINSLDYFDEDGFFNGKASDGRFRYLDPDHLRPFYARERALFLDALLQ